MKRALVAGTAFALVILSAVTTATSVLEVSVAEMLMRCELVFEGRVLSHETRLEAITERRLPHTLITFEVVDVIKGKAPGATVTLTYLGGAMDGHRLEVADMIMPAPGEQGFYFVESLNSRQVHPLYGWTQGHFRIESIHDGGQQVMTADGQPVTRIDASTRSTAKNLSTGKARGVEIGRSARAAMDPDTFKQQLREALGHLTR